MPFRYLYNNYIDSVALSSSPPLWGNIDSKSYQDFSTSTILQSCIEMESEERSIQCVSKYWTYIIQGAVDEFSHYTITSLAS